MRILPREARAIDVVGFGEASIDEVWRLPKGLGLGGKGRAQARDRLGGGQIATALCAASRLGARARYLGPIGDDAIGDEIARGLAEDGVELADFARVAGAQSRLALIVVEHSGERTVVEDGGAEAQLGEQAKAAMQMARALHVDGTRPRAAVALARTARETGTLVSIDIDGLPADVESARAVRELISLADLCVLPRGLPSSLTGERSVPAALSALAGHGPPGALCVETRGAEGALARTVDGIIEVAAFPIEAVDTTACGDTFRAALLCALLDGQPPRDALRWGSAAAALKCRAIGRRGCPTRSELEAYLSTSTRAGLPSR